MTKKKRVPELRFKGFTDDWEEKELGTEVADITGGGTPSTLHSEYWNGNIDWYSPTEIGEQVYANGSIKQITELGLKNCSAKMLPADKTLLFTSRASIGDLAILQRSGTTSQGFQSLILKDGYDIYFLYSMGHLIKAFAEKYSSGSTFLEISGKVLGQMNINIPLDKEQFKIGFFYKNLDALISLYQRKLDKLVLEKKTMLEKMFPQEGTDEPEIRFDGFKGKWEIKKLGELYTERNERGNNSLPILSVSIHHGVSDGELDGDMLGKKVRRSEDKSLYKHVYSGDLVFNMMRAWQGAIGVVTTEGMVSPAYISAIPNEHVYPQFMDCSLSRDSIILQMNNLSYGVTDFRKRLYWDSFINVSCHIPSIAEQVKISDFFQHLDSLISLHQRELDKLKSIKQACLEKMFV
jgi:type I restriction enzyme S subunit